MQAGSKGWDQALDGQLDGLARRYTRLRELALEIRALLVAGKHAQVTIQVKVLHGLFSELRATEKRIAAAAVAAGLLDSADSFSLLRVQGHERVCHDAEFSARLQETLAEARRAAREVALNRRLIERLAAWNQKEMQILLAPLSESTRYQAAGGMRESVPQPAWVDQRG